MCICVNICAPVHVHRSIHIHSNARPESPLQCSLPERRVHYCSLSWASSFWPVVSVPAWSVCLSLSCGVCLCVCVCAHARKSLALWNSGAVVLSPTSSGVFLVCVRMPGLLLRVKCGAVRPYGLSPQWPLEAAFVQRDLEREKEGERGPLLSPPTPHTHRLIIFSLYLENPHLKNTFKTVCLLRFLWFIFISGPPV